MIRSSMPDLAAILPILLPRAIAWAEARSQEIIANGSPLGAAGMKLARAVGVKHPERVRILNVPSVPFPEDPELRRVAMSTGLLGPGVAGLTLGYGIYIIPRHGDWRLLSHELRHVYQYEVVGSIGEFLPRYLEQIAAVGYDDAPFEIDARHHEFDVRSPEKERPTIDDRMEYAIRLADPAARLQWEDIYKLASLIDEIAELLDGGAVANPDLDAPFRESIKAAHRSNSVFRQSLESFPRAKQLISTM